MANYRKKHPNTTIKGCALCKPHKRCGNGHGATKPKYHLDKKELSMT